MNLNVRYLEEFVTLTEKKNFLEAAECLFISQSCLSKHIKKLETEIGVELFERTTRTVVLTEFGQMLLPYARKMVGLEYEFEKNVRRKIHQDSGNIVLGSIPSMKQHAITALIAGFLNENPDMTLQTIEGDSTFVKELLTDGKCDIAFLRSESSSVKEFNSIPYMIDYLTAVLPATHPLAKADNLPFEQLRGETFLLFPEHSFINDLCIRECRNAGFEPHIAYTGNRGGIEQIDALNQEAGLERIKIITPDGPANYMRQVLNSLTEEEFELFIQYHLSTCERQDLIGAAAHTVDILRK